jgi:hypothetical protein
MWEEGHGYRGWHVHSLASFGAVGMASVTQMKHTPTLVAECIDNSLGYSIATDPRDFGNCELVWAKKFWSLRLDSVKQLESLTALQTLRGALFLGFVEHLNIFWGEL